MSAIGCAAHSDMKAISILIPWLLGEVDDNDCELRKLEDSEIL